ncbi:hypothetical protein K1719_001443 [Acacia pycnantha]|nr:hypothetical protein K1719_001443 [Acacia pycnantha]
MAYVPPTSTRASTEANNTSVGSNLMVVPMSRQFPDVSKIEKFEGKNFKRWQERVYIVLDMHGVIDALTQPAPYLNANQA